MKKKLYNFLKEKGVLVEYLINNSQQKNSYDSARNITRICKKSPTEAINFAFIWGETTEGHYFWNNLDKEWRDKVENDES